MNWARILAFVTGMVDEELSARSEYLAIENRILARSDRPTNGIRLRVLSCDPRRRIADPMV